MNDIGREFDQPFAPERIGELLAEARRRLDE
jgi:hypothetical protein